MFHLPTTVRVVRGPATIHPYVPVALQPAFRDARIVAISAIIEQQTRDANPTHGPLSVYTEEEGTITAHTTFAAIQALQSPGLFEAMMGLSYALTQERAAFVFHKFWDHQTRPFPHEGEQAPEVFFTRLGCAMRADMRMCDYHKNYTTYIDAALSPEFLEGKAKTWVQQRPITGAGMLLMPHATTAHQELHTQATINAFTKLWERLVLHGSSLPFRYTLSPAFVEPTP